MSERDGLDRDGADDSEYDVILAAIPTVFALSYLIAAGHVAGSSMAMVIASMASGLLIVAALFLDPPSESTN